MILSITAKSNNIFAKTWQFQWICFQSSYPLGILKYFTLGIYLFSEINFKSMYFHIFAQDTIMTEQLVA